MRPEVFLYKRNQWLGPVLLASNVSVKLMFWAGVCGFGVITVLLGELDVGKEIHFTNGSFQPAPTESSISSLMIVLSRDSPATRARLCVSKMDGLLLSKTKVAKVTLLSARAAASIKTDPVAALIEKDANRQMTCAHTGETDTPVLINLPIPFHEIYGNPVLAGLSGTLQIHDYPLWRKIIGRGQL